MKRFALLHRFTLLLALSVASFGAVDDLAPAVRDPVTHILLGPAEARIIAAVRAADDERVAAVLSADPARLDAVLSDQLRYTHSTGKVETKQSYTDALVTHATVYETYEYLQRDFRPVTPDIVLMTGRMKIKARSSAGDFASEVSLLAVWRLEGGQWRFLAWQSAKLAPAVVK